MIYVYNGNFGMVRLYSCLQGFVLGKKEKVWIMCVGNNDCC